MSNIILYKWAAVQSRVSPSFRCAIYLPLLLLAFPALGCSDPNTAKRGEVSGSVKLDGKPIERGSIVFLPTNGTQGPAAGAEILDGYYHVERKVGPPAGDILFQFRSARRTGRKVPDRTGDRMMDEIVDWFPDNLRENSTIVRKIEPGKNVIDFDLSSDENANQK